MNKLRTIWQTIYSNWGLSLIASIILIHFTIGCSWSWMWLPMALYVLSFIAANCTAEFFAPIRMILWPVVKLNLCQRFNLMDGHLLNYTMFIWVEREGRTFWLRGGWSTLQSAMNKRMNEMTEDLHAVLAKVAEIRAKSKAPKVDISSV